MPSFDKNQLLGVVLSGGKSSRMGTDKGLLKTKDKTWVELSYQKLQDLHIPVCVSVNPSQVSVYSELLGENSLVKDHMGVGGPLEGLLSVHKTFSGHDLLLLACDMPDLDKSVLNRLVEVYLDKAGEHDFFVYEDNGFQEPFPGIYTAEGLQKLFGLIISGNLEKNSLKYVLDNGNTLTISITDDNKPFFQNYNEQKDLAKQKK
jgi:molybdenum cofactor guanylyltransferase